MTFIKRSGSAILFFLFILPNLVYAHGGFQKQAGSIIISIIQDPISPFVGDKVKFSFTAIDQAVQVKESLNEQELTNWPVQLTLIDSFYGDQSKDKVILRKDVTTDVNGDFSFEYTFPKEGYFDIEFTLKDSKGQVQNTGFLVQPRLPKDAVIKERVIAGYLILGFLLGVATSILVIKFRKHLHEKS